MNDIKAEDAPIAEREIISSRVFNFPRELVFKAWTDPNHLAQWWGPRGFTNTFETFELKPGGTWKFIMHGPNGVDFPNESVFSEIVPLERIVFQHISAPEFEVTATFAEQDGKTHLTFRMLFETAEICEDIKVFAVQGNEQNFDRLEAELAKMA